MFGEKKVIHTKRLFMRKPLIEDVEQFYSIIKEDAVGKWLAKSSGMSKEEAKASIQYAKEMMNENRIIARVKVENENSKKLLRNLGFTYTHDVAHSGRLLSYFELKTSLDKL
ncbi:GNAT family N-acetyltransferase [Bacillus cereus]|uniref:GNAT family N-acetyltransferase n=1 Tax=Bacillus cereus TaxID=1396 RepID=UPI000B4C18BD|nr:GNAT family N-acetyltransferase [Bacillus cereus]